MDIAIEKNRKKLLCLTAFWLALAVCVKRIRPWLPRRIGACVHWQIFKLEAATGFLAIATRLNLYANDDLSRMLAAAHTVHNGTMPCEPEQAMTLTQIIERLRAVRRVLKRLAKRSTANKHKAKPAISFTNFSLKISALLENRPAPSCLQPP